MNKMRRKEIRAVIKKLYELTNETDINKLCEQLADVLEDIEYILSEEECYKDNIPENLQNGERYESSEYSCDCLENAISELEYVDSDDELNTIIAAINTATDYLNDAI
jgi:uncharacterized protein Yka (UPF0111/DUF47 family)